MYGEGHILFEQEDGWLQAEIHTVRKNVLGLSLGFSLTQALYVVFPDVEYIPNRYLEVPI